jgi:hypothetical protein
MARTIPCDRVIVSLNDGDYLLTNKNWFVKNEWLIQVKRVFESFCCSAHRKAWPKFAESGELIQILSTATQVECCQRCKTSGCESSASVAVMNRRL